ncbi:MAG: hypothetical protein JW833_01400 [Prolixibacteraceae bacterium]|nr:hypothetical protein [Prolixibacteraceae bacterium]
MKKFLLIIISIVLVTGVFAQEENTPVSEPFSSGILIDQQTTYIPDVKTLEFVIDHKFGSMTDGISNLWGIYSSANVRLGLNYVIKKNFQVGAGITRNKKYTDLSAKWTILQQTTNNKIPVAVALYTNMAIDGRNESVFGTSGAEIFDRFSYFSQIIVGRKFNDWLSLQAGASFTHYNYVGPGFDHDKVGVHFNGRMKFSPQCSMIFNYDNPLKIKQISEHYTEAGGWVNYSKPNLAIGVEIFTFTHAFQIYVGSASGILNQDIMMWNQTEFFDSQKNNNKLFSDGIAIGFTITRLWMF